MANFKAAVRWIALNDELEETSPEVLAELVSVCLVADVWGKTPHVVALEVLRDRDRWHRAERRAKELERVRAEQTRPAAVSS